MSSFSTRNLSLSTLFGVMIFVFEILIPTPMDKAFTFFQAMLLSLGYLLIGVTLMDQEYYRILPDYKNYRQRLKRVNYLIARIFQL